MHTSCGSSTVPWKSSLDTLYIMRQHICLWIMHSSLTVDSEYSTWHETIHLWLTMSYLDNLQYWWQADCSNACTMCINNSGLAVDCGQFLTAVNLQTACSELSGRSSVAVSSLLNRMDLRYTLPMMHWFAQPDKPHMEILWCSVQPSKAVLGCAILWSALTYISEAISTLMVDRTSNLKAAEEHSCKQFAAVHACYISSTVAWKSILDTLHDM